jgi:hypothetical protein
MTLDIDIEDVLNDCSSWEIDQVIEWLKDNDYLENKYITPDDNDNILDIEFKITLDKIRDKRLNITLEDEEIIKQIANKL